MNDSVKCDQCGFRSSSINELITQILDKHKKHPEIIECQHCDYKALTLENFKDHIAFDHVENSVIGHLVSGQKRMAANFESFKTELTSILNALIDDHNVIKQELFILRQEKHENAKKLADIATTLGNLSSHVTFSFISKVTT